MITFDSAKKIAQRYVASLKVAPGIELVLLDDKIIEKPFGWVFFYDSKKHLETHDFRYEVPGSPLIIDRRDGSLHALKSAPRVEFYIDKYERDHPFDPAGGRSAASAAGRGTPSPPPQASQPAAAGTSSVHTAQPTPVFRSIQEAARHEPHGARRPLISLFAAVVAALAIGFIAMFGWLHWHTAANSVPVLVQYAPKDRHSIIQSVSLSSGTSLDFDPARVGTKFDKGISSAVLWYRWANATPGQKLEISWSKDGNEVLRQSLQFKAPSGEQVYALRTPDGSALPEGSYQVALIEAGKPATTIPFEIGAGKSIPQGGVGVAR